LTFQWLGIFRSGNLKTFGAGRWGRRLALAALSFGPGPAAAGDVSLPAFVEEVIAAIGPDGSLDLGAFDCAAPATGAEAMRQCRGRTSGVGFGHFRDGAGDSLGIPVEALGPEPEINALAGILVPDRAAFDAVRGQFLSLPDSPALRGLTRCDLFPPGQGGDPGEVAGFALRHPASGAVVMFIFGALDAEAARRLETTGDQTTVLLAILVMISPTLDCLPPG
jgi:hypothetical protein